MAGTLAERLEQQAKGKKTRLVRVGGRLQEVSPTTGIGSLQDHAAAAGLQTTPTSPAGAAETGVSPDAAKMAGTPASLHAGGAGTLAQTVARQTSAVPTEAQAAVGTKALADARTLQAGLSDAGTRASSYVQTALAGLAKAPAAAPAHGATTALVDSLRAKLGRAPTPAEVSASVSALTNPATVQAEATRLGLDPLSSSTNFSDWMKKYTSAAVTDATQVGAAAAAATPDASAISVSDSGILSPEEAGEIANIFNIRTEDLQGLSLDELRNLVDTSLEEKHTQVASLQAQLDDPSLDAATRADVVRQLREAGAVGVRAAEEEFDALQEDLRSAGEGVLEWGGKSLSLADALSDETLSGVAAHVVTLDPAAREAFKKEQPKLAGLVDFVETHEAAVRTAVEKLDADVAGVASALTERSAWKKDLLASVPGLPDEVVDLMLPGHADFVAAGGATPPALLTLVRERPDVAQSLQILQGQKLLTPDLTKQLLDASPEELKQLLRRPDGTPPDSLPPALEKALALRAQADRARNLGNWEGLTEFMNLPDTRNARELDTFFETARAQAALGGERHPALAILDADSDGKIDSFSTIREALVKNEGGDRPRLADLLGQVGVSTSGRLEDFAGKPEGDARRLVAAAPEAFADGILSGGEIVDLVEKTNPSFETLFDLKTAFGNKLERDQGYLQAVIEERQNKVLDYNLRRGFSGPDVSADHANKLKDLMRPHILDGIVSGERPLEPGDTDAFASFLRWAEKEKDIYFPGNWLSKARDIATAAIQVGAGPEGGGTGSGSGGGSSGSHKKIKDLGKKIKSVAEKAPLQSGTAPLTVTKELDKAAGSPLQTLLEEKKVNPVGAAATVVATGSENAKKAKKYLKGRV